MTRAAMLSIFVAAIAAAQQETPTPTFRAGTKLVEVDAVAGSKGGPATGLTKDDFTLFDNGKPQKIATFPKVPNTSTQPSRWTTKPEQVAGQDSILPAYYSLHYQMTRGMAWDEAEYSNYRKFSADAKIQFEGDKNQ